MAQGQKMSLYFWTEMGSSVYDQAIFPVENQLKGKCSA